MIIIYFKFLKITYLTTCLNWCAIICPCVCTLRILPVMVAELLATLASTSTPIALLCSVVMHSGSYCPTRSQSQCWTGAGWPSPILSSGDEESLLDVMFKTLRDMFFADLENNPNKNIRQLLDTNIYSIMIFQFKLKVPWR